MKRLFPVLGGVVGKSSLANPYIWVLFMFLKAQFEQGEKQLFYHQDSKYP